ncbi:ABC transporter substrate-binding protein [Streptomyces sp. Ru71]|uniref:extracellular solute-binding protein n=1 Tax=Streptomyces sp. Ru71 TaxID=2080746 RepID=UPI000CDCE076|nr:extracellular solute-binding protein [Streptomyces sp. Ru71]POX56772.1 ABC transporter substrate-binding protein [Streptomyces sp. Ru71]
MRLRRIAAALTLLAVAACTGGKGTEESAPPSSSSRWIVVASGRDVTGKGGIRQQLIDAWNRTQPADGYRARLVELPGSADAQRSQLLGALQSGSASYDVVNLDVTWVPEFAAAELIQPLPEGAVERESDLVSSVDGTSRWGGKRYAVPFNSDVGLLYYRRDHLTAVSGRGDLGSSVGWDELRQLIEKLNRERPKGYEAGWTTQLDGYEGRTVNAIEAFASAGGEDFRLIDGEGRYRGGEEQLAAGIGELRRRTGTAYTLRDAYESDEARSLDDFARGRTTFLRHWPYVYPTLYATFKDDLGVTRLPGKSVLGGQDLAVTSTVSGERAARAFDLIRFLTDPDSERCLLRAGFAATRTSAYEGGAGCTHAPVFAERPSASPTGESPGRTPPDRLGGLSFSRQILLPALREAVQRPRTPLYGAVSRTLITALGPLYDVGPRGGGAEPPDDQELAEALDRALKRELPH